MPLPKSWRRGSGFRSTWLKPHRRRNAMSLFLDCTMLVLRCVRLNGIRGLAKVPFLVLCAPVRERRCGLAETWCRAAGAPQLGSPIRHSYCSKSSGTVTALLNLHRTDAVMHKITPWLGFARTYPRLRRAKSGVFCIVVLSAPPQFCNIRALKLFMPADALPKLMFAPLRPRFLF